MTKDKALEELFLAQAPHFEDSADFMASLTKRLDAVEYIKQHQEATIAFVLSMPADVPLFTFEVHSDILLWLLANSRFITTAVLALLMSLGLASIIANVQDIMLMREKQMIYN